MPSDDSDRHWLGARAALLPAEVVEGLRRSHHVKMRDGVPIAIDAYLPPGTAPFATILRQTRYCRSLLPRSPLGRRVLRLLDHTGRMRRAFLAAGFAWIDVDVRGSGASGGSQAYSWNPDEVRDGAEIVDWIVGQPWSSGKVGSLGVSYDGTCAEMLLVNRHPAVRAIAPLFSLFDVYTDIAFPGGIHLSWFTDQWGRFNALLDRNATHEAFARVVWMLARARLDWLPEERVVPLVASLLARVQAGVRPVDGESLAAVIAEHADNYQVHEGALEITHRDDHGVIASHPDATVDAFSPHAFAADTAASGAAIYSYSGWRDGAYMGAAIRRYRTLGGPHSRLTIGPWTHGGRSNITPFATTRPAAFDHAAELVGFFAHHLQGRPAPGDGKPVHYFTMGESRWKSADTWPPPGTTTRTLYLGARHLDDTAPTSDARDRHRVDPTVGTGTRSRWRCMIAPVPSDYPDRVRRDAQLLCYDSAPLPAATEVTGHPRVSLHLAWLDATDGQIFAYLEDVAPDGRVAHVTEGMLRALHRAPARTYLRADASPLIPGAIVELAFELLPVSYRFAAGHRIRLAISGADGDSFAPTTASTFELHRSPGHPSRVELPIL